MVIIIGRLFPKVGQISSRTETTAMGRFADGKPVCEIGFVDQSKQLGVADAFKLPIQQLHKSRLETFGKRAAFWNGLLCGCVLAAVG